MYMDISIRASKNYTLNKLIIIKDMQCVKNITVAFEKTIIQKKGDENSDTTVSQYKGVRI